MQYPVPIDYRDTSIRKRPSEYLAECDSLKISDTENFSNVYDLIIPSLVQLAHGAIKVLELGVSEFGEGSGHAFSRMPYIEKYVGVDIQPILTPFPNRGTFIQGDCDSQECVDSIKPYAPFHLIIHDAEHSAQSQVNFFQAYIDLLGKPGVMIVENVYDYQPVLSSLNDPTLHILEVPPVRSQYSRCLLKFNF